jgi:hypothetical protein
VLLLAVLPAFLSGLSPTLPDLSPEARYEHLPGQLMIQKGRNIAKYLLPQAQGQEPFLNLEKLQQ